MSQTESSVATVPNQLVLDKLKLKPVRGQPIAFATFLPMIRHNAACADAIWERLVALVKASGIIPYQGDPYLTLLNLAGISSYGAFELIRGSELTVHAMFNNPLVEQMLLLLGPPGSGKTKIMNVLIQLLTGQSFYVLSGCRQNCQAINALKLFGSEDEVRALAPEFGDAETLVKLWQRALPPCDECFARAFEGDEPSLAKLSVVEIKLSGRKGQGMSVWSAQSESSTAIPLSVALMQGSHCCVLRDPFAARGGAKLGMVPETHILLQVVQEKTLPGGSPYSGFLAVETNLEAMKEFRSRVLDPGAYIRRTRTVHHGYNRIISREVLAYRDWLVLDQPIAFDPFALDAVAIAAIATRLSEKTTESPALDVETRMRIFDGDLGLLEEFRRKNSLIERAREHTGGRAPSLADAFERVWNMAGPHEAFNGLSMSFMLTEVINAVRETARGFEPGHQMSLLEALRVLTECVKTQSNGTDAQISSEQSAIYRSCLKNCTFVREKAEKAALVESFYRRWLKERMVEAFCPEAEQMKNQLFWQYFQHARADAAGATTFEDEFTARQETVDAAVLAKVETLVPDLPDLEAKKKFRAGLRARVRKILLAAATGGGVKPEPTWQTIPELKAAINKIVTAQTEQTIQSCLADENKQLDLDEQVTRRESIARFKALGYTDQSCDEAIKYYVTFELWRS